MLDVGVLYDFPYDLTTTGVIPEVSSVEAGPLAKVQMVAEVQVRQEHTLPPVQHSYGVSKAEQGPDRLLLLKQHMLLHLLLHQKQGH